MRQPTLCPRGCLHSWSPRGVEGATRFPTYIPFSLGGPLPQQGTGSESRGQAGVAIGSYPSFFLWSKGYPHRPTVLLATGPAPLCLPPPRLMPLTWP